MSKSIQAPTLVLRPVSVTRQMAAALTKLKAVAIDRGLELHHLGAGYPHPEVSDPTAYIAKKEAYFKHLAQSQDQVPPERALKDLLAGMYGYTDTLGPVRAREAFARVYGDDFGVRLDPARCIPTVGATGGIALLCSAFERTGQDVAYIVDAPTYTGFLSRASLYQRAHFYSVDMDQEGPDPEALRLQIRRARSDGYCVAFYYTVPDGHNPGGISFSQRRRESIMEVIREEGTFVVEDAPYTYISYEAPGSRPSPFIAMSPKHTVHLFTASKIGLPGPRVGFFYSEVELEISGGNRVALNDLVLTESSADILLHNPEALRAFEAYLMDESFELRKSLWPVAARKNDVYRDNRQILLDGLQEFLGGFPEDFSWTQPGAGFFSVFSFKNGKVRADQAFIERLVTEYGVVTIPMYGFYPEDAFERNPNAGYDQIRLSFSFSEGRGQGRRQAMKKAVHAFSNAVRIESGLPGL
ncbi:MAG: pyridoxal phosphate-dependent aminotransferase [Proteobacteria bacterium]|jgi:DNA-binding transcriptional MocR family regulator|nr:pyridoxal phosphate-dependent aminotransferase [Pseudomonadota bacterium]